MVGNGMMGGGMWAAMGIWWFFVIALLLALLVLAVLGSAWLLRRMREDGERSMIEQYSDSALDTLRHRYAAGEIDDDEFEHRLSALSRE